MHAMEGVFKVFLEALKVASGGLGARDEDIIVARTRGGLCNRSDSRPETAPDTVAQNRVPKGLGHGEPEARRVIASGCLTAGFRFEHGNRRRAPGATADAKEFCALFEGDELHAALARGCDEPVLRLVWLAQARSENAVR